MRTSLSIFLSARTIFVYSLTWMFLMMWWMTTFAMWICWDGIVDVNENCDDGNANNGDGCDSLCVVENNWTCAWIFPSVCVKWTNMDGDGFIDVEDDDIDGDGIVNTDEMPRTACNVRYAQFDQNAGLDQDNRITTYADPVDVLRVGPWIDTVSYVGQTTMSWVDQSNLAWAIADGDYLNMRFSMKNPLPRQLYSDTFEYRIKSWWDYVSTLRVSHDGFATYTDLWTDRAMPVTTHANRPRNVLFDDNVILLPGQQYDFRMYVYDSTNPGQTVFDDFKMQWCTSDDDATWIADYLEVIESCWNWILEWAEECDDGNVTSGDGCSSSCEVELCNVLYTAGRQAKWVSEARLVSSNTDFSMNLLAGGDGYIEVNGNTFGWIEGLAIDHTTEILYGFDVTSTPWSSQLLSIDPVTWDATKIGSPIVWSVWWATVDANGRLLVILWSSSMREVDMSTWQLWSFVLHTRSKWITDIVSMKDGSVIGIYRWTATVDAELYAINWTQCSNSSSNSETFLWVVNYDPTTVDLSLVQGLAASDLLWPNELILYDGSWNDEVYSIADVTSSLDADKIFDLESILVNRSWYGDAAACLTPNSIPSVPLCTWCGNGVVEWAEACDDGNTDDGDGCNNLCIVECPTWQVPNGSGGCEDLLCDISSTIVTLGWTSVWPWSQLEEWDVVQVTCDGTYAELYAMRARIVWAATRDQFSRYTPNSSVSYKIQTTAAYEFQCYIRASWDGSWSPWATEFCGQVTTSYCGNEVTEVSEQCDEWSANGWWCSATYGNTCIYCSATCQTVIVLGESCWDWIVNGDEECDGTPWCDSVTCKIWYCRDDAPLLDSSKNFVITDLSPTIIAWTSSQPNSEVAICFEDTNGSRDLYYTSTTSNGSFWFVPDLSPYITPWVNVGIMLHDENWLESDHHALVLQK